MMHDAIRNFPQQLKWVAEIKNKSALKQKQQLILCGMGGSRLAANIFSLVRPHTIRTVHRDYGLPDLAAHEFAQSLVVLSSYSGNTEEVLEAYDEARARGLDICVIAVGGALIARAEADGVAYIQFPNVGIQPRAALGYGLVALATLTNDAELITELSVCEFNMGEIESQGKLLAQELQGSVPLTYASARNAAVAECWKIKFNENTKLPAFWNFIPELNHNEMTGFDTIDSTREISRPFFVLMLRDAEDHPGVLKRFAVTEKLFTERGLRVRVIDFSTDNSSRIEKILTMLLLSDWTSVFIGDLYGTETELVPMVEEFKTALK